MATRKTRKNKELLDYNKKYKNLLVKQYPFNPRRTALYDPRREELVKIGWYWDYREWPSKKLEYHKLKHFLMEQGYTSGDLKDFTFSQMCDVLWAIQKKWVFSFRKKTEKAPTHSAFQDFLTGRYPELYLQQPTKNGKPAEIRGIDEPAAKEVRRRPPLSHKAAAVLELLNSLPEYQGLTGKKILEELDKRRVFTDQSTLTKSIIPALRPYGVKNKRGSGYYIAKYRSANIP